MNGDAINLQIGDLLYWGSYGLAIIVKIETMDIHTDVEYHFLTGNYSTIPQHDSYSFVMKMRQEFLNKYGNLYANQTR